MRFERNLNHVISLSGARNFTAATLLRVINEKEFSKRRHRKSNISPCCSAVAGSAPVLGVKADNMCFTLNCRAQSSPAPSESVLSCDLVRARKTWLSSRWPGTASLRLLATYLPSNWLVDVPTGHCFSAINRGCWQHTCPLIGLWTCNFKFAFFLFWLSCV